MAPSRTYPEIQFLTEAMPTPGQVVLLAQRAQELMQAYGVVPHPRNFALWYAYCTQHPVELHNEIDQLVAEFEPFTEAKCEQLFNRYISHSFLSYDLSLGRGSHQEMQKDILGAVDAIRGTFHDGATEGIQRMPGGNGSGGRFDVSDDLALVTSRTVVEARDSSPTGQGETPSPLEIEHICTHLAALRRDGRSCPVTGLVTRKIFEILLKETIVLADYYGQKLSVLLMDVNNFREFRGGFGERAGDQILRLIGRAIGEHVSARDTVARYDKKTFGMLLVDVDEQNALKLAETISSVLADRSIVNRRTQDDLGQASMSLGVAEWQPGQGVKDILQTAENALDQWKTSHGTWGASAR